MKLLYFVDLRAIDQVGKPLTALPWIWYNFGPFAAEVYRILDALELADEVVVALGNNFYGHPEYRITLGPGHGYYQVLSPKEVQIIGEVVGELGNLTPQALRDRSYQTEPMKRAVAGATRGVPLDLEN